MGELLSGLRKPGTKGWLGRNCASLIHITNKAVICVKLDYFLNKFVRTKLFTPEIRNDWEMSR